jgi:putative transposase
LGASGRCRCRSTSSTAQCTPTRRSGHTRSPDANRPLDIEASTDYYASTSPKAPTYRAGQLRRSRPSLTPSTPDPARPSDGRPPPKPSTSNYCCSNKPVLQRLVEPGQFRSRKFLRVLTQHRMIGSMGRVRAASDNAAMESFFSLLPNNVLNRQTWATRDQLRVAIVTWIERTYHRHRRQQP